MSYKLARDGRVQQLSDMAILPCRYVGGVAEPSDEHSSLVLRFRAWLALGNTPQPMDPDPPPPTPSQIIDEAFPQTGKARVLFEALFELVNDIRVLKGQAAITRAQLKSWLESKVP